MIAPSPHHVTYSIISLALILLAGAAWAQDCEDYAHTPAIKATFDVDPWPNCLVIDGNIAWLGLGATLQAYDLSNSQAPQFLGSVDTGFEVVDVALRDGLAFVANDEQGLTVIDLTDPTAPVLVRSLSFGDYSVSQVALVGNQACLAGTSYNDDLRIVDISDPATALTEVGILVTEDRFYDMAGFSANILLVGREHGLEVVDISDPATPAIVGYLDTEGVFKKILQEFQVAGDLVYARNDELVVLDLADPTQPEIVRTTNYLDVIGYYPSLLLAADRNRLYAFKEYDVACFDLSHATRPVPICQERLTSHPIYASALKDGEGWLLQAKIITHDDEGQVCHESFLSLVDLSNPYSPVQLEPMPYPGSRSADNIAVKGGYVYSSYYSHSNGTGVYVFDNSDPADPVYLADIPTPTIVNDIAAVGDYLYVSLRDYKGIQIVDVADPANPVVANQILQTPDCGIQSTNTIWQIVVQGNLGYFIALAPLFCSDLGVLDLSDPANPVCLDSTPNSSPYYDCLLAVQGDFAYTTGGPGLNVFDVSDPNDLQLIATLDLSAHCFPFSGFGNVPNLASLTCAGDLVLIGSQKSGLLAIDVTDPYEPQLVGWLALPFSGYDTIIYEWEMNYWFYSPPVPRAIQVADGLAYVANQACGVYIIDIADPANMAWVGTLSGGMATDLIVSDDLVIVADDEAVLQFSPQCLTTSGVLQPPPSPGHTHLQEIWPNPFNPQAFIRFNLGRSQHVTLSVFDLTGKRLTVLADQVFAEGTHEVNWFGRDDSGRQMPSGMYVVRLETDERVDAQKVMLLR